MWVQPVRGAELDIMGFSRSWRDSVNVEIQYGVQSTRVPLAAVPLVVSYSIDIILALDGSCLMELNLVVVGAGGNFGVYCTEKNIPYIHVRYVMHAKPVSDVTKSKSILPHEAGKEGLSFSSFLDMFDAMINIGQQ